MPKKPWTPPAPTLLSAARPPRLDGDDLYAWAQLVTRAEQIMQTKQQVAIQMLQARGFTPGPDGHLLTDDGYIVTQQELERVNRVRTIPTEASDAGASPLSAPQNSDSEN